MGEGDPIAGTSAPVAPAPGAPVVCGRTLSGGSRTRPR